MKVSNLYHARLLQELLRSEVTIEDLARGYASIDGKRNSFDKGKADHEYEKKMGHYLGYLTEMESIIDNAIGYAFERKGS